MKMEINRPKFCIPRWLADKSPGVEERSDVVIVEKIPVENNGRTKQSPCGYWLPTWYHRKPDRSETTICVLGKCTNEITSKGGWPPICMVCFGPICDDCFKAVGNNCGCKS